MSSGIASGWLQASWARTPDKCILCGETGSIRRVYTTSDRYQRLIGIQNDVRTWYICRGCGLMWQTNCLTEASLRDIYCHYRDTAFRDESIRQIFDRINNLPAQESENQYRYRWFSKHIGDTMMKVLDIGSGFGIWPALLSEKGWDVTCVEPNPDSCRFIREDLGIPCHNTFDLNGVAGQYNVVSIVHVLEHIRQPQDFLEMVKGALVPNGALFVEVPDSVEFNSLNQDHDEFNSTHLFFYDVQSLYRLLSRVFDVTDIHRVHYPSRGLYRVMALCSKAE